MSLMRRAHEWVADRFPVQYPRLRQIKPARTVPWEYRVTFGIVGLILLAACAVASVVFFVFLRAAILHA